MSGWGADISQELPISIDLFWKSYPWSPKSIYGLRHREGWLKVSVAEFNFSFGKFSKTLIACIDSNDRTISPSLANAMFEMDASMPIAPSEVEPYELLDEVTDNLLWDFIGETDQLCMRYLERQENTVERQVSLVERRYNKINDTIEETLRGYRKLLRQARRDTKEYLRLAKQMQQVQEQYDLLPLALSRELNSCRRSVEILDAKVMQAITEMPTLETQYSAQWRMIG